MNDAIKNRDEYRKQLTARHTRAYVEGIKYGRVCRELSEPDEPEPAKREWLNAFIEGPVSEAYWLRGCQDGWRHSLPHPRR